MSVTSAVQALEKAVEFTKKILAAPSKLLQYAFDLVVERLGELSDNQREKLRKLLGEYEKKSPVAQEKTIKQRKQEFLTKYKVKVLGNGKVSFTLPKGSSRIELLNEAQALAPKLLGRPAIYGKNLAEWANDPHFTNPVKKATVFAIDGNVEGSTWQTRDQQEKRGWNNVDLADLAVAHQAYLIATENDLFGGKMVRARDGVLHFNNREGLVVVMDCDDLLRHESVVASASLPSRNKKS